MARRPVALEDLLRFQVAGDTQISPDGRRILFTVRRVDEEKNKYYTRLWMADTESGEARPFTGDGHNDSQPRWSPDGAQIAFVSDRNGDHRGSQIYLIAPDGGEASALTKLEEGEVSEIVWSPDGTRIAFVFRATPPERTKKAEEERKEKGLSSPVRVHTRLFYRLDGFGYFDGSFPQVWVVDVKTGQTKPLTDEPYYHASLTWSPDGKTLAFIANRRDDWDLKGMYDDIWAVSAEGGDLQRIPAPDGPKSGLAWSPDGRWLAYVGHTDPEDSWGGRNDRVLVLPAGGAEEVRDLTGASDREVGYATLSDLHDVGGGSLLVWASDSHGLFFPMSERGDIRLYTIGLNGSGLTALTPARQELGAFSVSRDQTRFGLLLADATQPHDAYLGLLSDTDMQIRRVSAVNRTLMEEVQLQMPEEAWVPNGEGGTVHTWVLRPPDFDASQKYPCVLYVHGGPAAQYGGQSTPFHELQWLAANGYVVLFSNPRGSKGYGEAHTSAIKGDWGTRDWVDVQAVADYGAALPYVDSSRMAIMGGSYGGYMTAWAVGHTDRFACAICDRLVSNLHSMSGTSDFAWNHGRFFKGNAWDDPSDLWRVSPLAFAGRITTPLLIIHSDGDLRCPIGQAEELFAALRHQRKTVEFVRYPAESSHGMSRNGPPDLRLDRLRRNLAWLDRYLKG